MWAGPEAPRSRKPTRRRPAKVGIGPGDKGVRFTIFGYFSKNRFLTHFGHLGWSPIDAPWNSITGTLIFVRFGWTLKNHDFPDFSFEILPTKSHPLIPWPDTRTLQCTTVREKSKMLAPKNHKNRQNAPKNSQDAPKTLPGYPQDALRRPKKAQDAKKLIFHWF